MRSDYFIRKPVLAIVISAIVLAVGLVGIATLRVKPYPKFAPTVVHISATYPGADARSVAQAVALPIERALEGTPGMAYIQSVCSNAGTYSADVTFDHGVQIDKAVANLQKRLASVVGQLPATVTDLSVRAQAASKLMTISLRSSDPKYDGAYLSNYAASNLMEPLQRIRGVGNVLNVSSLNYSLQIWTMPDKLGNLGLTVGDLQAVLADQNRAPVSGMLGQTPMKGVDRIVPITVPGELSSVTDVENIILRATDEGAVIRLKDVARVSLEASANSIESGVNGQSAAVLDILLLPGANALKVASSVKSTMTQLGAALPAGISYEIPFDTTDHIEASFHRIFTTLFFVLLLTVAALFLLLRSWRAVLVVATSLAVALIGSLGVVAVFGFSLNLLTLLGLILSIGFSAGGGVLLVGEILRIMHEKQLGPSRAAIEVMQKQMRLLVWIAAAMCVVFIPISFFSGTEGTLFRQFSVSIVTPVLLSVLVSWSLTPLLCIRLLRHTPQPRSLRLFGLADRTSAWINDRCLRIFGYAANYSSQLFSVLGAGLLCVLVLNWAVPRRLLPQEDQGYFTVELELADGSSLERTRMVTDRAMKLLLADPAVESVLDVTGYSPRLGKSESHSQLTVILRPTGARRFTSIDGVMARIRKGLHRYPECSAFLTKPAVISGLGNSGGFEMVLTEGRDLPYEELQRGADSLMRYLSQRRVFADLAVSIERETPQLRFEVDRDKAQMLGASLADIFTAIETFSGAVYVNDFVTSGRTYPIYVQTDAPYRAVRDNLNLFSVRGAGGVMIPVTALGTMSYSTTTDREEHFCGARSATISGQPARGYTLQRAMNTLERLARKHLPSGVDVQWIGLSSQQSNSPGSGTAMALAALFVFLLLVVCFKDWAAALATLFALPFVYVGAYLGVWIFGIEQTLFFQLALVLLTGLVAQIGILLLSSAKQQMESGATASDAITESIPLQFNRIASLVVVVLAALLPLVLAWGPGATDGHSVAVGLFFGAAAALMIGLPGVGFFYVGCCRMKELFKR